MKSKTNLFGVGVAGFACQMLGMSLSDAERHVRQVIQQIVGQFRHQLKKRGELGSVNPAPATTSSDANTSVNWKYSQTE